MLTINNELIDGLERAVRAAGSKQVVRLNYNEYGVLTPEVVTRSKAALLTRTGVRWALEIGSVGAPLLLFLKDGSYILRIFGSFHWRREWLISRRGRQWENTPVFTGLSPVTENWTLTLGEHGGALKHCCW